MKKSLIYILLFLLSSCKEQKNEPVTIAKPEPEQPCAGFRDTTIHQVFKLSSAPGELGKLVKFIESKGELKQYQGKGQPLYFKDTGIILTRLLCEEDIYNTPKERWFLDSIAKISTALVLKKTVPGAKDIFGTIQVTQCSFGSTAERDSALAIFKIASWGDPEKKWNEYSTLALGNNIYIFSPSLAMMQDPLRRCLKAIDERWR
ncbi:MAG TPA: hypothetical protein PLL23_05625 [Chitinophagaceae bacterium]|nr:hypothetical protein [Chitinophagaceae bacterium]